MDALTERNLRLAYKERGDAIQDYQRRLDAIREAMARESEGEIDTEEMRDLIAGALDQSSPMPESPLLGGTGKRFVIG